MSTYAFSTEEEHSLVFSTYIPTSYEYIAQPAENFVKKIQDRSNGKIQVDYFHSAQLFEGHDELSALSRGDIDITNMTGTYPTASVPLLGLFSLPFMFDDIEHLRRAIDAGILDLGIYEVMENEHDIVILGVAPLDPYELYSRTDPILKASDFSGKVWASTGAVDAKAIQLLGGSPTGMSSSELYLAFDRGVVDATPRPLITGIGRSLDEVVEHISLATFLVDTSILAMNKNSWENLSSDLQEMVIEAAKERDQEQFEKVQAFIDEAFTYYEENGVEIHQLDDKAISEMRDATSTVIEEWAAEVENGDEYLEIINSTRE